ncbi:hypothetical protein PC129_g2124 [Phytophthora cactorum]|uniref:Uncharacterized protein n=1 Tax=Phytophthora cactorum TaxID=29920 RepID=A0A8T1EQZ5_9STRA|nr:hypothetical protein Pcac1_g13553 [Phytophthora cactorum]KAG2842635.1 hypothetical protein PC111_g2648 [Phytophthora cactorum]KAG2924880.1 hypothetical protein PC114_g4335 [Phytophthora cactorum]KAG2954036.1 hypothetical protein PC117_g1533 [Phytophthora cactorum]KAG3031585.1 hypothetical protein PC120_g3049 [Phytophthora cactorum]
MKSRRGQRGAQAAIGCCTAQRRDPHSGCCSCYSRLRRRALSPSVRGRLNIVYVEFYGDAGRLSDLCMHLLLLAMAITLQQLGSRNRGER